MKFRLVQNLLNRFLLPLLIGSMTSSCQKAENVLLADGDESTLVLGWSVTESGNPQISTINYQRPKIMIEINRAHIYRNMHSDGGLGVGTAMIHSSLNSTARAGISTTVHGVSYQFVFIDSISQYRLFSYPILSENNLGEFIRLDPGQTDAMVHLSGYRLTDSLLNVPGRVEVISPAMNSFHSVSRDLVVQWNVDRGGTHLVVILRTLENTGEPERFLIKNLRANERSVRFSPEELSQLPLGRTHLMIGTSNIKRESSKEVVLVGQSSGASVFMLQ